MLVGVAFCGLIASLFIPSAPSAHPETRINLNLLRGSFDIVSYVLQDRILLHIVLLLSWFIVVGAVFIGQLANYAHAVVRADNQVYIIFLTVFSTGMAVGSLVCDTLLKGQISTKLAPISGAGVALFTILMVILTPAPAGEDLATISEFFGKFSGYPVSFCMFMIAVCGGVCLVPLYAAMQERTSPKHRSQIIAASNLSDSICITAATLISALILALGASVQHLFIIIGLISPLVALSARKIDRNLFAILVFATIFIFSGYAQAKDMAFKAQNAFTRAAKEPLSGTASPVPNPQNIPCYSVVDCRKKGGDLETVWQFYNNTDYAPKDYPERCYVPGEGGKYVFSPASCHSSRK